MRLWIAAIGSRPRDAFDELAKMYLDRIAPLLPGGGGRAGLKPDKPGAKSEKSGQKSVDAPLFRDENAFWHALDRERSRTAPLVVLLDERGRGMDSQAFAAWLGRELEGGRQLIVFAVGPADGWDNRDRGTDAMRLSLGPMTLAHELARVVLCEQVYRALTILKGHPYHRAGSREGK